MTKISLTYNLLVFLLISSCGLTKKQSETSISSKIKTKQVHFAQSYYDSCSLNKYPPSQYRYHIGVNSGKTPTYTLDSCIWVKSGDEEIGTRAEIRKSWLFWEDLNQCHNLGFFDNKASNGNKAGRLPVELDFSNFKELRHFRSHSIISEKHLNEILQTAKKLKGFEVYLDRDLPDKICDCKELEYLTLYNFNEVNLPSCLANLPKLKYLRLVGISGNMNDIVWRIPSLQALFLEGGEHLEAPSSIGLLKNLKHLKLSLFDTLSIPIEFNDLDSLELLELFRINKKINYSSQFESLERLRALKMTHVSLTSFPRLFASKKMLYFSAEQINELDICRFDFTQNPLIHTLKLSGEAFSQINRFPNEIEALKNLEILHLIGFSFRNVPKSICNHTKLKDLKLIGEDLSYESLKMIYDYNGALRQNGLRSFYSKQGNLNKTQQEEIQTLKTSGTSLNSNYLDRFLPTFDYYMFKLKYYQEKYRGY